MESFGQILKEAREAQNLSVEDLASLTRIQEHYLRALEEDRFEALPQQVFTKGFVRTYARALNMDEAEVMRKFSIASGSHYQHEEEEQEHAKQQIVESRKGKANRNAVVVLTGLVLIGLLFILPTEQSTPPLTENQKTANSKPIPVSESKTIVEDIPPPSISRSGQTTGNTRETASSAKADATKTRETAAQKPDSKPAEKPVTASSQSVERPSTNAGTSRGLAQESQTPDSDNQVPSSGPMMTMNLEALEITWVVVSSDDGEAHEALLQPGETAQWKANDHFVVTLGNAGGVNVKINGQPRGPFGKPGTVVRDLMIRP